MFYKIILLGFLSIIPNIVKADLVVQNYIPNDLDPIISVMRENLIVKVPQITFRYKNTGLSVSSIHTILSDDFKVTLNRCLNIKQNKECSIVMVQKRKNFIAGNYFIAIGSDNFKISIINNNGMLANTKSNIAPLISPPDVIFEPGEKYRKLTFSLTNSGSYPSDSVTLSFSSSGATVFFPDYFSAVRNDYARMIVNTCNGNSLNFGKNCKVILQVKNLGYGMNRRIYIRQTFSKNRVSSIDPDNNPTGQFGATNTVISVNVKTIPPPNFIVNSPVLFMVTKVLPFADCSDVLCFIDNNILFTGATFFDNEHLNLLSETTYNGITINPHSRLIVSQDKVSPDTYLEGTMDVIDYISGVETPVVGGASVPISFSNGYWWFDSTLYMGPNQKKYNEQGDWVGNRSQKITVSVLPRTHVCGDITALNPPTEGFGYVLQEGVDEFGNPTSVLVLDPNQHYIEDQSVCIPNT